MIRILHSADFHLDSPFAGLQPEQAAQRRQEQRELLFRLAEVCRSRRCDLVLLAGDLFDSAQVYEQTLVQLRQALAECGVPVLIAPGNHDCLRPGSAWDTAQWPENVHVFRSAQIEALPLPDLGLTVYGAGFAAPHSEPLLRGFRAQSEGPAVMVLHGDPAKPDSPYDPISEQEIRDSGLNYLALGHVHSAFVRRCGEVTVGMPGCPMGRGFDECGSKGALLVTLDEGLCRTEFLPLGAREYRVLGVTLTAPEDGAAPDYAVQILAQLPEDAERHVYRIVLTGRCPAPELPALEALLRERVFGLELIDRTQPRSELWAALEEDSLKGAFLRRLRQRCDEGGPEAAALAVKAARLGLDLMEGREL